ncbi:MAG: metallopeptidase family protein [Caldisericia bacterium]|nr:metallopeptidase family protein [Caldisericia bacterium]MDD4614198.1 metallopeptidase family protein [Caldisericia bacterium]
MNTKHPEPEENRPLENQIDDPFIIYAQLALQKLPKDLREKMINVSILVQDEPFDYQLKNHSQEQGLILGLYEGIPNPGKAFFYNFCLPDKITLFRHNILKIAAWKKKDLRELIAEVVYHEIGHHFGFNEDDLESFKTV